MNLYEMYLIDAMIDFSKDIKENKKIIVQYKIFIFILSYMFNNFYKFI